jgi:signal transduction histidine kinase
VAGLVLLAAAIGVVIGRRTAGRLAMPPATPEPPNDAGRLKEEFLATVSHELRTPLNAVLGWTELLRTTPMPPAELTRGLEVIDRNARRQLALVDELLAAASPEHASEGWERVDVRELVTALVDRMSEAAAGASITLEHDPAVGTDAEEPPMWVRGNQAGLRLALRHILENAIKFTPAGGRVRAWLRRSGDRAVIEVTDTGPGLDPRLSREVFEPFRQEDGSRSRRHGGLGLGLSIARRLVEAHGGQIDVRSDGPGRGATFLVTLPLCGAR